MEIIDALPSAVELEVVVLGAILLEESELTDSVVRSMQPDMFYDNKNSVVFKAIKQLNEEGSSVDLMTVAHRIRRDGFSDVVSASYLSSLTSRVASTGHIKEHSLIVKEKAAMRKLIHLSHVLKADAYNGSFSPDEVMEKVESMFSSLRETNNIDVDNSKPIKDYVLELNESIDGRISGKIQGISTGFLELDRIIHGYSEGNLVIIGGRPGMGKSAMMMSSAIEIAKSGVKSLIFSLEMTGKELTARAAAAISGVEYEDLMHRKLDDSRLRQYHENLGAVDRLPIYIDDTAGISVTYFQEAVRMAVKKHGVQVVFVDYLQLMKGTEKKGWNREQEIAEISRGLKQCAKTNSVPVIALAQLSRGAEGRDSAKPKLKDLRESGQIEQDADVVLFPYRHEYYGIFQDEAGHSTEGMAEIIVAKNRHGACDTCRLRFIGRLAQFKANKPDFIPPDPNQRIEPRVKPNSGFLPDEPPF
jgi:replicative DNA helicase